MGQNFFQVFSATAERGFDQLVQDVSERSRQTTCQDCQSDAQCLEITTAPLGVLGIRRVMVGPTELESVTSCVSSRRSNQLSYGPVTERKDFLLK